MNLLTKLEKKYLKYLAELLDYGVLQLNRLNGTKFQFGHLPSFLLYNHIAIHNYSEAVYLLCKDSRLHSAYVLLRSIFEAHTNAEYIKFGDSERKLSLFAKEGFIVRKKIADCFDQFIKKYPQKKESISVLEEKNINKMKEFSGSHIKGIDNANKLNQNEEYPDILRRSIEIDKNSLDIEEKGNSELYYHLVYRYLSPYAHLNLFGLETFVDEGIDGDIKFILGRSNNVSTIIMQTYAYYFVSLNGLFEKKILDGEIIEKYKKYFKEFKNNRDLKTSE
ncbi:MAG: DUF5677 domain-containing protein [Candidatus Nealsonbacteria bacterium]|nr:DUF5677 domain-containing protein [Candidatus Nealsonbacteria bacterium]